MSQLRRERQQLLQTLYRGPQASAAPFDATSANPHLTRKVAELDDLYLAAFAGLLRRVCERHGRDSGPAASVGKATNRAKG